ncbi:MAG: putative baseplate assembly protein [Solirubrobacteraceae bacterium]
MTSAGRRVDVPVAKAERRRALRRVHGNGLDTVEVDQSGRRLVLTFLEQPPADLGPGNVRIDGPAAQPAVTAIRVRRVTADDPQLQDHLVVDLDQSGGTGPYRLCLVELLRNGRPGRAPLRGLDPLFVDSTFVFDIELPNPVLGTPASGPAPPVPAPAGSYLARDYQGLRRLLLDRLARTIPGWTERHIPDLMVTLVEMFAYLGDELSYYQDAVATEAYLQTARQRISMRRHGRLVGYRMHDGCHARAWVSLEVDADAKLPESVSFSTSSGAESGTPQSRANHVFSPLPARLPATVSTVEPPEAPAAGNLQLRTAHNCITLWAWGATESTLVAGATSATLAEPREAHGRRSLELHPGDVIMFEELSADDLGPPDPAHRHPVRLTSVHRTVDPLYDQLIVEVQWALSDALPFPLPVTARDPEGQVRGCSVARGNIVLVGEGRKTEHEWLSSDATTLGIADLTWSDPFPDPGRVAHHQAVRLRHLYRDWIAQIERWRRHAVRGEPLDAPQRELLRWQLGAEIVDEFGLNDRSGNRGERAERDALGLLLVLVSGEELLAARRRRLEVLSQLAVTSGPLHGPLLEEIRDDWGEELAGVLSPYDPASWGPAADATDQDPRRAEALLVLTDAAPSDDEPATEWLVTTGLVDVSPDEHRVVVEVGDDAIAHLRFNPSTEPHGPLHATYLAGNGSAGNVAAETITVIIPPTAEVRRVRNPLPATGGTNPEPIEAARRAIPGAYLIDQPRAITTADYAALAENAPGVRRAAATLRWSGNRMAVRVAVQPTWGKDPDGDLLHLVEQALGPARRIGHDLWIVAPDYRALLVTVRVRLEPDAIRQDMWEALAVLLSSGRLVDGTPALFHPENLGFGVTVHASSIVAAIQELPGVESVVLTQFTFLDQASELPATPPPDHLEVGPTEIARLHNDPTRSANGYARIELRGGR